MMPRSRFLCFLALAASLGLASCRSVRLDPHGEMVAVYQFGEFRMLVNGTAPQAAQAARAAFRQLDLYETGFTSSTFEARLQGRARNDQKVSVTIAEANSRQTLVRIRWGEGGNLANSRLLFDDIERNMGR